MLEIPVSNSRISTCARPEAACPKFFPFQEQPLRAGNTPADLLRANASTSARRRPASIPVRPISGLAFQITKAALAVRAAPGKPAFPSRETFAPPQAIPARERHFPAAAPRFRKASGATSETLSTATTCIHSASEWSAAIPGQTGGSRRSRPQTIPSAPDGCFRREHIQNAATNRILTHHLHRVLLPVANAFQVRHQFVQGNLFPDQKLGVELPVIRRGSTRIRAEPIGITVMATVPKLAGRAPPRGVPANPHGETSFVRERRPGQESIGVEMDRGKGQAVKKTCRCFPTTLPPACCRPQLPLTGVPSLAIAARNTGRELWKSDRKS